MNMVLKYKSWWPTALAIVAFSILLGALFLEPVQTAFTADKVIAGLASLIGTFVGAWAAFAFARYKSETERKATEIAAGNRALFILIRMIDDVNALERNVTRQFRGRDDAWLNLSPSLPFDSTMHFDLKELSFLMQGNPPAFQALMLEERRYHHLNYLLKHHSDLVFKQVWPTLSAAKIQIGDKRAPEELKSLLGPSVVQQLSTVTASIVHHTEEDIVSLDQALQTVRDALKELYPDVKFLQYKLTK